MALLYLEGFETFKYADFIALRYTAAGAAFSLATGKNGGSGASSASATGTTLTREVLAVSAATLVAGFRVLMSSAPSAAGKLGITFREGGGDQLTLLAIESGSHEWKFELRRGGAAGTVIATQTTAQYVGKWYYVDFKSTLHTSTGTYAVNVNGVSVLSGSGANTAGTAGNNGDGFTIRLSSNGVIDDLYVLDTSGSVNNDVLGEQAIQGLLPNGAGNQTDWTASSGGANYTTVDEAGTAALASDRNYAQTLGDVDLYAYSALTIAPATPSITGVQIDSIVAMDASGTRDVKHRLRSGGSEQALTAWTVSSGAQAVHHDILEENPVGPTAWTLAGINGIEAGIEVDN